MKIPVIGLMKVRDDFVRTIINDLNNHFTKIRLDFKGKYEMPEDSYNSFRDMYKAENILDALLEDGIILAVTDEGMYAKGMNYIFSKGEYRGPMIVSTQRLRPEFYNRSPNPQKLRERTKKEIVYVLGKCFGLDNCSNLDCVMYNSKSIKSIDEKSVNFCSDCSVEISTKGLEIETED